MTKDADYYVVALRISCSFGLCPDSHPLTVVVSGFINRYSTYRGSQLDEVHIKTFDPTGSSQVDFSNSIQFANELQSGSAFLET